MEALAKGPATQRSPKLLTVVMAVTEKNLRHLKTAIFYNLSIKMKKLLPKDTNTMLNSLRWFTPVILLWTGVMGLQLPSTAQPQSLYNPIPLNTGEMNDTLTEQDIPTGQGGFARDYRVQFSAGDQVAIDVISDTFDTVVTLIAKDGSLVAENDDAPSNPEATTNSLLFTRITQSGNYIIRVRSFGEATGGEFTLKVTRLRPM